MSETFALPAATVHVEHLDGTVVIEVAGDVDMGNADGLLTALTDAVDRRPDGVVVDLTRTTFFCSAGINLLVVAAGRARDQDVAIVVLADHSVVLRPLQLAGVEELLTIRPTREAALAATQVLTTHGGGTEQDG
jgi:anti-anti-sigma factor